MSEVHTRRVIENFHYQRLSSSHDDDDRNTYSRRYPEMFYIESNDDQRNLRSEFYHPNSDLSSLSSEQKPDYLTNENEQMQPKLTSIIKQPYEKRVTTYMISTSNEDDYIPHSPSLPVNRRYKKKHVVKFDKVDDNISNNKYYSIPLSKSKASESIQRSMNKYRFNGN